MKPINEGEHDPRIINEHFHDQLFSFEDRSLSIYLEKEEQCSIICAKSSTKT